MAANQTYTDKSPRPDNDPNLHDKGTFVSLRPGTGTGPLAKPGRPGTTGQPGEVNEHRGDPMPDRPDAQKPYPRDADGPNGI